MLELAMKSHGDNGLALCGERLQGTGKTWWLNPGWTPALTTRLFLLYLLYRVRL
jgi:hypothetical protein